MRMGRLVVTLLPFLVGHQAWAANSGAGPDHGLAGVAIYVAGIAIVAWVFIYTVKCFWRPGEQNSSHVKRRILREGGQGDDNEH